MLAIHGHNYFSWGQKAIESCEATAVLTLSEAWRRIYHRSLEFLEAGRQADRSLFWMIEGTGDSLPDMTEHLLRFQEALTQEMLAAHQTESLRFVQQWFGRLIVALVEKASGRLSLRHSLSEPMETVFFRARDGMYISSFDGRFLHANQALLTMLGYASLEELQQVDIAQELYADGNQRSELLEHLRRDGFYDSHEFAYHRADGRQGTARESCYRVDGPQGKDFIVGTLIDITEEKEREARTSAYVAELEARTLAANLNASQLARGLADLLDLSDNPVLVVSAQDLTVLDVNQAFRKKLGFRKRDLETLPLKTLFQERDWELIFPQLSNVHNRSHFHLEEIQVRGADGELLWVRPCLLVHLNPSGTRFFLELVERGEQRQTSARGRHLEQTLRSLIEASPAGIMVFGPNGQVLQVNRQLRQWMGYSRDQMMDADFINELFTKEEQRFKFRKYIRHFLVGHHVEALEIRLRPKVGKPMDFLLRTMPYAYQQAEEGGFLAFLTDISALKQVERLTKLGKRGREDRRASSALEQRLEGAAEQMSELEGRLDRLQKLFSLLAERMGIGLETSIGLSSLILTEHKGAAQGQQENLRFLYRQMADLDHMLANAQLYCQWIQQAPSYHPEIRHFATFFRDLAKRIKPAHLVPHVHWVVEEHLEEMNGERLAVFDPLAVERIARQLVHNASRFTVRGAIVLAVRLKGSDLFLSVQDSGCGISATDTPHIFDPFFQGLQPPAQGLSGLGLGLTLARVVADSLGCLIRCESQLGQGSQFTFLAGRLQD